MKLAQAQCGMSCGGVITGTGNGSISFESGEPGSPTGTLILADHQWAGVGRVDGRRWESSSGNNLLFTLVMRPKDFQEIWKLNFVTSVAVVRTCSDFGIDAGIKWPNDIWVENKKLCGYLINSDRNPCEQSGYSELVASVGVGINVNEDMTLNATTRGIATSFFNILNRTVERELVLATFCNHLEKLLGLDFGQALSLYQKHDMLVGKSIVVKPKKIEHPEGYNALAIGFTDWGQLKVQLDDGSVKELLSDEVMFTPAVHL
jgi:BirA family biotin operon repressor/biotin-[acetyl-CoA-carboxylase] ligase